MVAGLNIEDEKAPGPDGIPNEVLKLVCKIQAELAIQHI